MSSGISNKLTAQIGEHLVSAMLGTLGFYATPYSGNVPGFDITAVDSETLRAFPVQVKTSNGGALIHSTINKWVEHSIDKKNYQQIGKPLPLHNPNLIWVMVRIKDNNLATARYFVCTEKEIQERIVNRFIKFMEKHDYRRPGGGASTQAVLDIRNMIDLENNWGILKENGNTGTSGK